MFGMHELNVLFRGPFVGGRNEGGGLFFLLVNG